MASLDTLGQYITECRRLLQDEVVPYRYPQTDLVDALNLGLLEARRLRADLFLPRFEMPFFNSSSIDLATPLSFDPMYRPVLVYYVVGRIQLRDDEPTTDQRAAALLQKFTQQLMVLA